MCKKRVNDIAKEQGLAVKDLLLKLQAAGIDAETAQRALDAVFDELDPDALLEASLAKRLAADDCIADDRQFQRLFRYLIGQGFEADRVLALLRRRKQ
jgi:SOS response regulatory protein OraA/RecX